MTEYNRMAKGTFVSNASAQIINLPFTPAFVEMYNYTAAATPANHGIPQAVWSSQMGQGFAQCLLFDAGLALTTGVVIANGISSFSNGLALQYGPAVTLGATGSIVSTSATVTTITTSSAHGLVTGNVVIFQNTYQTATTGMPQLDGIPFVVTVTSATVFTINWNASGSNYTALNGATSTLAAASTFMKVLYPYLYAPGVAIIEGISTTLGVVTVVTTAPHNFVIGQEIAFRITPPWGSTQLNSLPDVLIPGSPIYFYVATVPTSTSFTLTTNPTYTAFNPNVPVLSVSGLTPPQVLAVGDVNTGGVQISAGSKLYPPPLVNGISTINGPAIQGAYVNNTSQGFIIGNGATSGDATSNLVGANGNVIYWRAFLDDISLPN